MSTKRCGLREGSRSDLPILHWAALTPLSPETVDHILRAKANEADAAA